MINTNCARSALLRKVQQHYFAMLETGLYLDGHPYCQKALAYFEQQRKVYEQYMSEYEAKYGALTFNAGANGDCWNWIQGPWPWECEAN